MDCDPAIYWPNNVRRIEARILIPIGDDPDPWQIAKELDEAIGEHFQKLSVRPGWFASSFIEAEDAAPVDVKPSLRIIGGTTEEQP